MLKFDSYYDGAVDAAKDHTLKVRSSLGLPTPDFNVRMSYSAINILEFVCLRPDCNLDTVFVNPVAAGNLIFQGKERKQFKKIAKYFEIPRGSRC